MKGHRKEFRGLLYKEWKNLWSSVITVDVLFIVLCSLFIPSGTYFPLFLVLTIFASLMVLSSITQDNEAKWSSFALTTAVSRQDVVMSKYLLMIIGTIITWLIGILLYIILKSLPHLTNIDGLTITLLLVSLAAGLLHGAIMIPMRLKYDSPYIHYVSIVFIGLLSAVAAIPYFFMMDAVGTALYPLAQAIAFGLLVVSIIAFGVSYLISQKIFAKKRILNSLFFTAVQAVQSLR